MDIKPILFIHLSVSGHFSFFHFWAIMNNDAINICVDITFSFLLGLYRSEIVGLYCNSLKNFRTVFHSGCAISQSDQQCLMVPISPCPSQHLLLSISFIIIFLVSVKWHPIVVFPQGVIRLSIFSCIYWQFFNLL